MNVEFDRSFDKSLDNIRNKSLYSKIEKTILTCEKAISLSEIPNVKKLAGHKTYYRIRIGDYRMGFELIEQHTIRLILIAHRKDIYKSFPG